jgi:hypothetical protein
MLIRELCKCRVRYSLTDSLEGDDFAGDVIEFVSLLLDAVDMARAELFRAQVVNDSALYWQVEVWDEGTSKWIDHGFALRLAIFEVADAHMDVQEDNMGQLVIYTDLMRNPNRQDQIIPFENVDDEPTTPEIRS